MLKRPRKDHNNGIPSGGKTPGISAGRGALYRVAGPSLLILLLPLLAGFTYLVAIKEPALHEREVERLAASYAEQQAARIHQLELNLRQRMRSATRSPLVQSAVAGGEDADLALVESTLADFFPEAMGLRILPIDDLGTAALASDSLRNHIEVDLVRRAATGSTTQSESYQYEGKWLTTLAERISHAHTPEQRGVLLLTLDNTLLDTQLAALLPNAGEFTIEQRFATSNGRDRTAVIASAGRGTATRFASEADIPDPSWRVVFMPSAQLVNELQDTNYVLLGIMGLSMLAAIVSIALLLVGFPRLVARDADRIMAAADKKTALQLDLPELVALAKQLRRATLRSARGGKEQGFAATQAELAGTTRDGISVTEEDGGEVLELELGDLGGAEEDSGFPSHIFRAYDIRGLADSELSDDMVASIGGAIGSIAGEQGQQALIVGCDGRESSARIKNTLIRALMESGRDVIDIGMVSTPLLYFATHHLEARSGVMVTGSHNPMEYNGLKIVIDRHTIAAGGIQDIRDRARRGRFSRGNGRIIREDIVPDYIEEIATDVAISAPIKVVIDAGNGATGPIAPALFEALGCEVIPLYCDVDGSFPNHSPDTSNEDNLQDLVFAVQRYEADLGVAFDGDGDRVAAVTGSGRIVRTDLLMMLFAQDVVSRNPGADVVFDVKCSRELSRVISSNGGRPVLWKTGHAFMKEKMAETGALLGGEFSGHIFFGERWFGFDDGMYAAARLIEILSTYGYSLDEALATFPETVNTPEILVPISEREKFSTIGKLVAQAEFDEGQANTLDGLRVDFAHGWGLVRASNTSPALTARFEASDDATLGEIQQAFHQQLKKVSPGLELPF